jgi:hypothetical protein
VAAGEQVAQLFRVYQSPAIPELVVGPLFLLVARQLSQITGRSQVAVGAVAVGLGGLKLAQKLPLEQAVMVAVVARGSMAVLAVLVGLVGLLLETGLPVVLALVRLVELVVLTLLD